MNTTPPADLPRFLIPGWYEQQKIKQPFIEYVSYSGIGPSRYRSRYTLKFHKCDLSISERGDYVSIDFSMVTPNYEGFANGKTKPGLFFDTLINLCECLETQPPIDMDQKEITNKLTYGYMGRPKSIYSWNMEKHKTTIFSAFHSFFEHTLLGILSDNEGDVLDDYKRSDFGC